MARVQRHNVDLVVVLLLFVVYAVCALLLCTLGAQSYQQTVNSMEQSYHQRTGVLYLAQKLHQNDIGGGVRVDHFGQGDALVLIEQNTGQGYENWIFIKDGWLCEEQIQPGATPTEAMAQQIMQMEGMKLSLSRGVLSVSLTTQNGASSGLSLAVRSSGGTFNTGNTAPEPSATPSGEAALGGATIMTPAPGGASAGSGSNGASGSASSSASGSNTNTSGAASSGGGGN